MKIQQIRNATMIINYGGYKFLIDPFLSPKGTYPPFQNTHNQHLKNPIVELPVSIKEIIDVDAVIVTHLHVDHFDDKAKEAIPKDMKIFSQNEEEAKKLKEYNFKDIEVLKEEGNLFNNITLFKTKGQHGSETVIDMFRKRNLPTDVCGVVFNHKYEKSLYIAGDTILCNEVKNAIDKYKPRIIVINAGHAQYVGNNPLIMGKEDFYETTKISPNSIFIATHMEAVNHAMLSRNELREYAKEKEFSSKLLIPQDGEVCDL